MGTQLDIFSQMKDHLDEVNQSIQKDVLEILAQKLAYANSKIKDLVEPRSSNADTDSHQVTSFRKRDRAKYAVHKKSLEKAIDQVESWQRHSFNPMWFVAIKIQSRQFDRQLDSATENEHRQGKKMIQATMVVRNPLRDVNSVHIFLSPNRLESAQTTEIAFSTIKMVKVDSKWRLLDFVTNLSKNTVRELAVRLKSANPVTFGLLKCLGAVHHENSNHFSIIYATPNRMTDPETLRARIIAREATHSLSDRFQVAKQLAHAVFSIHTFGIVHKGIRPENIIIFHDSKSTLGSAFLLGFEKARWETDATRLTEVADWAQNLYRHPQRQGSRIEDRYIMQHDIYSLGVCLLEVGLWRSFVEYDSGHNPIMSGTFDFGAGTPDDPTHPELIKSFLLSLVSAELPGKMGTKYAAVVESCLTCLDLDNEDFGDESELQEDGVNIAVRFIEKVHEISTNRRSEISDSLRFLCN
jgi:serine/threonine protein kinase